MSELPTELLRRAHAALTEAARVEQEHVTRWGPTIAAAFEAERLANEAAASRLARVIVEREDREWRSTVAYLSGGDDLD